MTEPEYLALCRAAERGDRAAEAVVNKPYHITTHSPIERLLIDALTSIAPYKDVPEVWEEDNRGVYLGLDPAVMFELATQETFGPYRVDAVLSRRELSVVVECDGYAFHSTPEQRARDAKRDRYLVSRGMYVLRFTGSEIHRDPEAVAEEVLRTATNLALGEV